MKRQKTQAQYSVIGMIMMIICITSNAAYAQLITQQPSSCNSNTYYDGRMYSCAAVNQNTVDSQNSELLTCSTQNLYRKLGQICVLQTGKTVVASTQAIYVTQNQNTDPDFIACQAGGFQVNNQICIPQLNKCTPDANGLGCLYLDSIQQLIPYKNEFSLSTYYKYKTNSNVGDFSYIQNILQGVVSSVATSAIETTFKSAFACQGDTSTATDARQHPKSCNYLINKCLVRSFLDTVDDCAILKNIKYSDGNTLYQHLATTTSPAIDPNLYIMIYEEDGEFVDFRALTTELQLCDKGTNDDSAFKTFGTSFDNRCNLDPSTIKSTSNFFEVYTKDSSSQSGYTKIQAKVTYQDMTGSSSEMLVTRFYLYEKSFYNSVIQVANNVNLIVDIDSKQAYFKINYRMIDVAGSSIRVNFSVSYQSNSDKMDNFWLIVEIIFGIYMVIIFLWVLIRVYIWTMYNPRFDGQRRIMPQYSKKLVVNVFTIICDCYGEALIFFLFILSGSIFIIAKASQAPNFIIPPEFSQYDVYYSFIVCCAFGFSFKLISTFYLIYKQSSCQIYFLDWEPVKKYAHVEENKGQSSWRTLFVANEFNELSVYRLVSVEWTLFFMAMFMSGVEWQNGASNTFSSSSDLKTNNVKINTIYKFFIDTSLFFFIALVQIIGRHIIKIWVPFKIQDFSDFCSVSNISIFIFDDYLHGYYLHGQSPDKHAEGNSLWLMSCLGEDLPFTIFGNNQPQMGGYPQGGFNNSMMRNQFGQQGMQGMQGFNPNMGYASGRQGFGSFNNQPQQLQQQPVPGYGWNQDAMKFKSQKAKRGERGLNNTDQQMFEFFISWDLRDQIDYLFKIREDSIHHIKMQKKQIEFNKKVSQKNLGKPVENNSEEQKSLKDKEANNKNQNEEIKNEVENFNNYFADLTLDNGEQLFKPKMDGIFKEVIRNMNQGSGQNSNVYEMEFLQRFFMHLPPPSHVDRRFNQNMFYIDRDNIFSSVLYSGYEFTLLYFLIIVYAFIDLVSESTLVAVIVTYALDYIFKYIRQEKGQQNLSSKAGIEDMFLI